MAFVSNIYSKNITKKINILPLLENILYNIKRRKPYDRDVEKLI